MLLLNIEYIPGKKIEALGIAKGSVVQSKNFGKDFMAGMKTIVGGEIKGYTEMLIEARQIATKRMVDEAEALGADAVVGFGGYASAPVLWAAQRMGVPTVIQEQNSYAGVTNKILAKGARRICTAYEGMERFFPAAKIVLTGNPLRGRFSKEGADRAEALEYYGLTPDLPVILVVGGSLGTRSLNEMMKAWIVGTDGKAPVQVIWQTGKYYEREMQAFLAAHPAAHVWQGAFIDRMDYAYAAADLVVSRSGAGTVSELCLVAKPVLFVPSPNVAEDHQTKNARALETKGAAVVVPDAECRTKAMPRAVELLADRETLAAMSRNLEALARPDAAEDIVNEIVKVMK